MGWKALKEAFDIKHFVQVTDSGVCIGSAYVHNLLTIDPKTGAIAKSLTFSSFGEDRYPELMQAKPERLVELLSIPDTFSSSCVVYTYENDEIIEKLCEEPGWPNVTHDGCMMHDNTFSTDKAEVVRWAKQDAALGIKYARQFIENLEADLAKEREKLESSAAALSRLNQDYPATV